MAQGTTYHKLNSAFPSIKALGSVTYNPSNLVDGAGEAKEVTATGAALGDFCICSFSLDVADVMFTAHVTAANTVTVWVQNESTGTVNLGSGTLKVIVFDTNSGA